MRIRVAAPSLWRSLLILACLAAIGRPAPAQTCAAPTPSVLPPKPCEPTLDNPNPCPAADIKLDVVCRFEDCMATVTAVPESRQPMLEKVEWTLSDGFHLFQRGQTARLHHIFPTGGTTGAQYTIQVTPTFKDIGARPPVTKIVTIEGEKPYFGYNTNFWGLTVEFGTTFGNIYDWRFEWDYGDGTIGQNPSWMTTCKTYEQPGRYLVRLKMWRRANCPPSGCNEEYTVEQFVDVPNRAPDAKFTNTQNRRDITVDASTTTDEPLVDEKWLPGLPTGCGSLRTNSTVDFRWDWGDGTFSTGKAASHTFTTGGAYRVKLLARDRVGVTQVAEKVIGVPVDPPLPAFAFNCVGRRCDFDASAAAQPGVTGYNWTFGSTPASTPGPQTSFIFPTDGYYVVAFSTQSGATATLPVRRTLRVTSRPIPELLFVPTGPCRIIDTRNNGGLPIASGQALNVSTAGCIPNSPDIAAIQANIVTVVTGSPGSGKGVLYVYRPGFGDANRVIAQSFNKAVGSGARANNTIVQLGTGNVFSIVPNIPESGTAHIIVDTSGYFVRSGSTLAGMVRGLKFASIPYCTAFDSVATGTPLSAGLPAYHRIRQVCGIPLTAEGASLHLRTNRPTMNTHFSFIPSYLSSTITSTINAWANAQLANGWLGALGRQTAHDVRGAIAYGTSHYSLIANGYFEPDAPLVYYPIDPCRTVDTTRPSETGYARPAAETAQFYQVQGNCGVPRGAVAAVVNVTAVNPSAAGELALYPSDAALYPSDPLTGSVFQNFVAGDDITTGAIVPLSVHQLDFGLRLRSAPADVYVDVVGYFAPPGYGAAAVNVQEQER